MIIKSILVAIVAFIAIYFKIEMDKAHYFEEVVPFRVETCKVKEGVNGCESMGFHKASGNAILACSSREKRAQWWPAVSQRGNGSAYHLKNDELYRYNMKDDTFTKLELEGFTGEYHSHGIGVIEDPENSNQLIIMAVNHKSPGSVIEIFAHDLATASVQHLETIESPLIYSPNGVVPLSRRSFYVSNDLKIKNKLLRSFEVLGKFATGNIVFRDDSGKLRVVADGIPYANGVTISNDKQHVFVASSVTQSVYVFVRNEANGGLSLLETVQLDFTTDNVWTCPETGAVYVAGLWNAFDYLKLEHGPLDKRNTVATRVSRIVPNTDESKFFGKNFKGEPYILAPGPVWSDGTSVVVDVETKKTIVGSIYNEGLFVCEDMDY